ncbi:MAG: hypothetical protein HOC20_10635 [Chloroflexi bacterium]|nr:hypothetical protein [Chloroflexota bacterium]
MKATKTIAWLLFAYWVLIGVINMACVEGMCAKGSLEFLGYAAIGGLCCFLTLKIGGLFAHRSRKVKDNRQTTRWWS